MRLRFRRPANGSPVVFLETSGDLAEWASADDAWTLTAVLRDSDGGWETVEFRTVSPLSDAVAARAYWRLRVNLPPQAP